MQISTLKTTFWIFQISKLLRWMRWRNFVYTPGLNYRSEKALKTNQKLTLTEIGKTHRNSVQTHVFLLKQKETTNLFGNSLSNDRLRFCLTKQKVFFVLFRLCSSMISCVLIMNACKNYNTIKMRMKHKKTQARLHRASTFCCWTLSHCRGFLKFANSKKAGKIKKKS